MKKYAIALCLLIMSIPGFAAPSCLHPLNGEQSAQTLRRESALRLVRLLNTAEAALHAKSGRFGDLKQLLASEFVKKQAAEATEVNLSGSGEILRGFDVVVYPTAAGYTLLVGDKQDVCGFAYLTNERAVIFEAVPIDVARRRDNAKLSRGKKERKSGAK